MMVNEVQKKKHNEIIWSGRAHTFIGRDYINMELNVRKAGFICVFSYENQLVEKQLLKFIILHFIILQFNLGISKLNFQILIWFCLLFQLLLLIYYYFHHFTIYYIYLIFIKRISYFNCLK